MIKLCEICNEKFDTTSSTRIYCYKCSGELTRTDKVKQVFHDCRKDFEV